MTGYEANRLLTLAGTESEDVASYQWEEVPEDQLDRLIHEWEEDGSLEASPMAGDRLY